MTNKQEKNTNNDFISVCTPATKRLIDGKTDSYVQITVIIILFIGHAFFVKDNLISNVICAMICFVSIGSLYAMVDSCRKAIVELVNFYIKYINLIEKLKTIHSCDTDLRIKGKFYDEIVENCSKNEFHKKD